MGGFHRSRLLTRDPTLLVLAFALWSCLSGISLLWPGEVFQANPAYRALTRLGISEDAWGGAMLGDATLLLWTTLRNGLTIRAGVAVISGAFWLYFGTHVFIGGVEAGVFSVVGLWEVSAGAALLASAVQWMGCGSASDGN